MTEDPEKTTDSSASCKSIADDPSKSETQMKRPAEDNAEDRGAVVSKKPAPEKPVFGSAAKSLLSFSSFTSAEPKSLKELIEDAEKEKVEQDDGKEVSPKDKEAPAILTGEEDELTLSQFEGTLFHFKASTKEWSSLGSAQLKVNKTVHDSDDYYRIVIRSSSTLRLIGNYRIFKGMHCEFAPPKSVRFSAIEEGHPSHYNFRAKTSESAIELQVLLEETLKKLEEKSE